MNNDAMPRITDWRRNAEYIKTDNEPWRTEVTPAQFNDIPFGVRTLLAKVVRRLRPGLNRTTSAGPR